MNPPFFPTDSRNKISFRDLEEGEIFDKFGTGHQNFVLNVGFGSMNFCSIPEPTQLGVALSS